MDDSPSTKNVAAALIAVSSALAIPLAATVIAFGWAGFAQAKVLVELDWIAPVAQAFMILASLSLTILLLGRYRVLGGAWAYWVSMAFAANAVFGIFYLLAWPGVMGERGSIVRLSNTAIWFACLATFTVTLQFAAVNARRPERLTPGFMLAGYAGVVSVSVLIGLAVVLFERALPVLFDSEVLNFRAMTWFAILAGVTAAGGVSAWRRCRSEKNPVLGYLALFSIVYAYGIVYSVLGRKRYDIWWYAGRAEVALSYVALLFGLLQEGYRLFSGERDRAEERAQLLRELDARTSELSRSNAELAMYAHTVSHDLVAPLSKISFYNELLMERAASKLDDKERDLLDRVQKTAVGMTKMLRDILALSRVGRESDPIETVDWKRALDGVMTDLEVVIAQAGAVVSMGEMPRIRAQETLFRQLLLNLIANAVKFRDKKRAARIEVGSRTAHGGIVIFVRDNGIGFPSDDAEEIFKPFVRLNADYEGHGIGLATCRRIAQRLGGRLTAEGVPGEGSTFTLWLPGELLEQP